MESDLACPVHGASSLDVGVEGARDQFFGIGDAYDYRRCRECGALVLDPRPSPTEIGPFYAGYYPPQTLEHLQNKAKRGRRIGGAGRFRSLGTTRRLRRLGVQFTSDMKLLDVGCGLGAFARYMRGVAGIQTRGVDFSSECQDFAKQIHELDVDVGELRDQQYADGSFDFVTSWHYLEHVYDPQAEIDEMARIIKPGGWLVAETPTNDILATMFQKRWLYLMPPTHLYHYRPNTMQTMLERAGLEVKHIARPWFPGEFAGSVMFALGLNGFIPKVFGPNRPWSQKLLTVGLFAQMVYDIPLTLTLALLGRSGLLRVFAQKKA